MLGWGMCGWLAITEVLPLQHVRMKGSGLPPHPTPPPPPKSDLWMYFSLQFVVSYHLEPYNWHKWYYANEAKLCIIHCCCNMYILYYTHVNLYTQIDDLPKPPVEVLPFCDIVAWRNSPNVSVEEISGYDVRLINQDTSKEEIRHTEGYETFIVLDQENDVCIKQNHTHLVKVDP